jgi:hypothetical protein
MKTFEIRKGERFVRFNNPSFEYSYSIENGRLIVRANGELAAIFNKWDHIRGLG